MRDFSKMYDDLRTWRMIHLHSFIYNYRHNESNPNILCKLVCTVRLANILLTDSIIFCASSRPVQNKQLIFYEI